MSLTTCVLGPVGAHCTQSHTPGQLLSCTPLSVTFSPFPVDLVLALDSKEWCGSSPRAVFPVCCAVLCCLKGWPRTQRGGGLSLCTSHCRGNGVWQGSAATVTVRSSSQDSSSSCWMSHGQCSFSSALTLTHPSCSFSNKPWGNTVSAGKEKPSATLKR